MILPRVPATCACLVLGVSLASAAAAALPAAQREGPSCPPTGCAGPRASAFGQAAGFSAASLAALLLARHRRVAAR
jgi:hypothetical protein